MKSLSALPKPKRSVPIEVIKSLIKLAKGRKTEGQDLREGEAIDLLRQQGIHFADFYWSVMHALEDEVIPWIDIAALQVDIEPYGQPVLVAFRRKVDLHWLQEHIPHYDTLTKRN